MIIIPYHIPGCPACQYAPPTFSSDVFQSATNEVRQLACRLLPFEFPILACFLLCEPVNLINNSNIAVNVSSVQGYRKTQVGLILIRLTVILIKTKAVLLFLQRYGCSCIWKTWQEKQSLIMKFSLIYFTNMNFINLPGFALICKLSNYYNRISSDWKMASNFSATN